MTDLYQPPTKGVHIYRDPRHPHNYVAQVHNGHSKKYKTCITLENAIAWIEWYRVTLLK